MWIDIFLKVLGVALIILVIIYLHDKFFFRKKEKMNSQLNQLVYEQNKQFEKMVEINNSLEALKVELEKPGNISSEERLIDIYVNRNGDKIENVKRLVVVGDSVLDAVLSQKKLVAQEKKIALETDIRIVKKLPLSDVDKVSLFGNILDNAIEAAEQVSGERYVYFQITQKENNFVIICSNSKMSDLELQIEVLKTTKKDKENHGRGIHIIKNIVNQYHGVCLFKDEGDTFHLKIML